jgi:antitoxin YefM
MTRQVLYTEAQTNLDQLCNQAVESGEAIVIQRPNRANVVLLSEKELSSLLETLYLFRSPANATKLLSALQRANAKTTQPQSVDELLKNLGLDEDEDLATDMPTAS